MIIKRLPPKVSPRQLSEQSPPVGTGNAPAAPPHENPSGNAPVPEETKQPVASRSVSEEPELIQHGIFAGLPASLTAPARPRGSARPEQDAQAKELAAQVATPPAEVPLERSPAPGIPRPNPMSAPPGMRDPFGKELQRKKDILLSRGLPEDHPNHDRTVTPEQYAARVNVARDENELRAASFSTEPHSKDRIPEQLLREAAKRLDRRSGFTAASSGPKGPPPPELLARLEVGKRSGGLNGVGMREAKPVLDAVAPAATVPPAPIEVAMVPAVQDPTTEAREQSDDANAPNDAGAAGTPPVRPPLSAPAVERAPLGVEPGGYAITPAGVFKVDSKGKRGPQITLTAAAINALVRDADGRSWAASLRWLTLDGETVEDLVPMSAASTLRQGELLSDLANQGLLVLDEAEFKRFLAASFRMRLPRLRGAHKTGFAQVKLRNGREVLCFVRPSETLYPDGVEIEEPVVLLPPARLSAHRGYVSSGTLAEWQEMPLRYRSSALHIFVLCVSLSGLILALSSTESGGFHLVGVTSRGKTTLLQLAATPHGSGAVSSTRSDLPSLIVGWSATDSALEVAAQAASDAVLPLDELGMRTSGAAPIYLLSGGQSKERANKDGGVRERLHWNTTILSTGEVPMGQHIETVGRRRVRAGELTRLTEIDISTLLPEVDPSRVEWLTENCSRHFGTAAPAFVKKLLNRFGGDPGATEVAITAAVVQLRDQLRDEALAAGFELHSHQVRAMRRIALAGVAGIWAARDGILPLTEDEVLAHVRTIRDSWLRGQAFVSEDERAIEAVRDYYVRHSAQVLNADVPVEERMVPNNCHGIQHQGRLLLTDSNFVAACAGLDPRLVARALYDAGILRRNDDQNKSKISISELGISKVRFYVLTLSRLLGREEAPETPPSAPTPPRRDGGLDDL